MPLFADSFTVDIDRATRAVLHMGGDPWTLNGIREQFGLAPFPGGERVIAQMPSERLPETAELRRLDGLDELDVGRFLWTKDQHEKRAK